MNFTASLAAILFIVYFLFMLIASASVIISISMICADKLKEKIKINDTLRTVLTIAVLCIVYRLLQLIPVIGVIVTLLVGIIGFGLLLKSLVPAKEQN